MENLPLYISLIFGFTTLLTVAIFYLATKHSALTLIVLLFWIIIQSAIALTGFYTETKSMPPRLLLAVVIPVLLIFVLFFTSKGRNYIDSFDIKTLTLLHTVRIPVELVLYWLFLNKGIPQLMTFEGRNFDILSGITAPLIFYFGFIKKQIPLRIILIWNFICLLLLINIVSNAVLSAPFPFQKFAFDFPNIAVLYFPFNLLPACVVPLVLFSHLIAIRQLILKKHFNAK